MNQWSVNDGARYDRNLFYAQHNKKEREEKDNLRLHEVQISLVLLDEGQELMKSDGVGSNQDKWDNHNKNWYPPVDFMDQCIGATAFWVLVYCPHFAAHSNCREDNEADSEVEPSVISDNTESSLRIWKHPVCLDPLEEEDDSHNADEVVWKGVSDPPLHEESVCIDVFVVLNIDQWIDYAANQEQWHGKNDEGRTRDLVYFGREEDHYICCNRNACHSDDYVFTRSPYQICVCCLICATWIVAEVDRYTHFI